jgi:hypothetical protein
MEGTLSAIRPYPRKREMRVKRPTQAWDARHPEQRNSPFVLIHEVRRADGIPYPAKRESRNGALLSFELCFHRYLDTEIM